MSDPVPGDPVATPDRTPLHPLPAADPFAPDFLELEDELGPGRRWSTWDDIGVLAGPEPWPTWLVTESAAVDTELGVLKTGKEADVFLLERADADDAVVLAAERYRTLDHRLFSRDAGCTEGRRMRNSRFRGAPARPDAALR